MVSLKPKRKEEHLEFAPPDTSQGGGDIEGEIEYRLSRHTLLTLVFMSIAWGTCTLANIGPSSTYSYVVAELGGDSISSWIPNAALFPLIGLQPIWGAFSDRFGKKWFIVAGGFVGLAGNVVSATAKRTETVIGGQALSGIGSSLFLLVVPAAMEIVQAKHRSFTQGGMGLVNGLMGVFGLLEAGAFSKLSGSGWRWVYYFNAVFFAVSGAGICFFYHPPPPRLSREDTATTRLRDVDYVGMLSFLIGTVGLVLALTWGGNAYAWNSPAVIATFVVAAVFLILFGGYETWIVRHGVLDHRFFQSRNFPIVMSVAFIDGMLLYGVNSFLPIEISGLFTQDPVKVNVYLLPLNILVLVGVAISSYILGRMKRYRAVLSGSVFLLTLFCGLLALVTSSRLALMLVFTALMGLGVGVTTVIPVVILTYSVPSHLLGTAGTLFASCRALGGTVGVTIFTVIHNNAQSAHLVSGIAQVATEAGLPISSVQNFVSALINHNNTALMSIDGGDQNIISAASSAMKSITAQSFRYVWVANAAFGACAGILTLFLLPVTHMLTGHVESALETGKLREKQLS